MSQPSPRLQPLTAALLLALTPLEVTRAVVEHGVGILGAHGGLVALVVGEKLKLIEDRGYPLETLAPWLEVPLSASLPLSDVARSGTPFFLSSRQAWHERFPSIPIADDNPVEASVALPLSARGDVLGVIYFSFEDPRDFWDADRALLEELARQCALALDRAQLLEEARAAERQQGFLSRATAILSESLDYTTRLESLARLCVPALADWSGVDIIGDDGNLQRVAVAHRDPALEPVMREVQQRFPPNLQDPDAQTRGIAGVVRTGRRVFAPEVTVDMLTASGLHPEHLRLLIQVGIGSVLILPLTAHGQTVGAITLGLTPPGDSQPQRVFNDSTIEVAEEVARRAAIAVDNARMFETQRQAAEALAISEERYRRLLATALEGIMFVDTDVTIVYANQRLADMLGYDSPRELIGKQSYFLLFPEDTATARDRWQARVQGIQGEIELRLRRKDGGDCWVIAHVSVERGEKNGVFQGTFTMFTDITERLRIQEELRARNEEVVTIFERVTDAFSAFDHEWRFTYVNSGAERLLGRSRDQLLGKCIWDIFEGARDTPVFERYLYAVREQVSVGFEVYYGPLRGWFEVRAHPSPTGLSAYFRDITERKMAEMERETAASERATLVAELQAAGLRQRRFLREMLSSLTEGRLLLCDSVEELPTALPFVFPTVRVTRATLRTVRRQTAEAAAAVGLSRERRYDILTAVGEASMNAVVHAEVGEAQVSHDGMGQVRVTIRDHGKGIAEDAIHRATLERGYSSAGTLGHGFWIILKTVDRVYLLTGPRGTTVVLEQSVSEGEPGWLGRE